ncbi:MAG TPA: hypothetical protein PKZ36_01110 [Candidatus Paceibacterota bacterium]|nr:hypothetical protein [Candidatus Paceibacterota bacterium]HPT17988.1 hypothetical protein [Candidatus Paceibacterota bacterium]
MIYLFAGDDVKNKIENYEIFLESLKKEMEIFFVNKNNFDPIQIESFYSGSGLFFSKCVIVFTNIFEKEEIQNFVLEKLSFFGESQNLFIFSEGKLNKTTIDAFKKARAELNIFELPKYKKEKYNSFLLANAFEAKDKIKLWIYFRQAIDLDVAMEELAGILSWKVKDMILKRNFSKFKEEELQNFSSKLSYLLPEARRNGIDAESAFEQFLLEAF